MPGIEIRFEWSIDGQERDSIWNAEPWIEQKKRELVRAVHNEIDKYIRTEEAYHKDIDTTFYSAMITIEDVK